MKKGISLLLILFITLGLLGCSEGKRNKVKKDNEVNIGYFANVNHGQALLIKNKNPYSNWKYKRFSSGPSALESLLAGATDIAYIGVQPALNGFIRTNGDLVAISSVANGGASLIVRDKNINRIEELKGKKLAIPQYGNSQDLLLRVIMREHGMKDKALGGEIEIASAPNPDIKILLERGQIDGALVPEPWASELKVYGKELYNSNNSIKEGKYATAVVVVRKDFLENNEEEVEKFLEEHYKMTLEINENKVKAARLINKGIKEDTGKELNEKVVLAAVNSIDFTVDPLYKSSQYLSDVSFDIGLTKKKVNIKNLYRLDLLNRVKEEVDNA